MSLFKRGRVWWYEFSFAGRRYRESTKTGKKTIALEAEKARKEQLQGAFNGVPVEKHNRMEDVAAILKRQLLRSTRSGTSRTLSPW